MVHQHVEVHLLRPTTARPFGRLASRNGLEGDASSPGVLHRRPVGSRYHHCRPEDARRKRASPGASEHSITNALILPSPLT
jgi:hypothetical protein